MAGTEVGSIDVVGGSWENVFVGRVTSVDPTPTPTACGWPPSAWATKR